MRPVVRGGQAYQPSGRRALGQAKSEALRRGDEQQARVLQMKINRARKQVALLGQERSA